MEKMENPPSKKGKNVKID